MVLGSQQSWTKSAADGGLVAQSCPTLATPWTVASQAPLSTGLSRQEYWSGLSFPSPGNLPDPGIEPWPPALQTDCLLTKLKGSPEYSLIPPPHRHGQPPPLSASTRVVHLIVTIGTHRHHPKSIVYTRVHSWWCTFYAFVQCIMTSTCSYLGLPWRLSAKDSICQCKGHEFDPWVGKILWRRKWQLTPEFLPGKSRGQRSLAGYILSMGLQKSRTRLSN